MNRNTFLTVIYKENYSLLQTICRRKVGYQTDYSDIIDEAIQETFIQATKDYDKLKDNPMIKAWLIRTCLNRLMPKIKKMRFRQKLNAFSLDDPNSREIADKDLIEEYENNEAFSTFYRRLIKMLTAEEKEVFTAYFIERQTMIAIAYARGISENKVKIIIQRIRRRAKKALDEKNP